MNKVLFSRNTDDWKTPKILYDTFMELGYIDLFPFQSDIDQFTITYKDKYLFCNPPFSKMKQVSKYILELLQKNNHIKLLVPVRSDTKWYQSLLPYCKNIWLFKGRMKFNDLKTGVPFPVCLLSLNKIKNNGMIRTYYGTIEEFIQEILL